MSQNLGAVLKYLYPDADLGDYAVSDDGTGCKLMRFDVDKLGPVPTQEQLDAQEAEAVAYFQAKANQRDQDQVEIKRLRALPRKDWTAADVKSAVQIWISRQ